MRHLFLKAFSKGIRKLENETLKIQNQEIRNNLKSCGSGLRINGKVEIHGRDSIRIGNNVHIGGNAFIRGEGGLIIEDNVHISRNLVLYTINHNYAGKYLPYDGTKIDKPVRIGKNAWIGMNVCIAPGTNIGEGAIIGIGTTIFGDVPPLAIVGSGKWSILSMRDADHYEYLESQELYGGANGEGLK